MEGAHHMNGHVWEQVGRFVRVFAFAFLPLAASFDWEHLTRSALLGAVVAAAETAYRQFYKVNADN
jgi:hypothetical protein